MDIRYQPVFGEVTNWNVLRKLQDFAVIVIVVVIAAVVFPAVNCVNQCSICWRNDWLYYLKDIQRIF